MAVLLSWSDVPESMYRAALRRGEGGLRCLVYECQNMHLRQHRDMPNGMTLRKDSADVLLWEIAQRHGASVRLLLEQTVLYAGMRVTVSAKLKPPLALHYSAGSLD